VSVDVDETGSHDASANIQDPVGFACTLGAGQLDLAFDDSHVGRFGWATGAVDQCTATDQDVQWKRHVILYIITQLTGRYDQTRLRDGPSRDRCDTGFGLTMLKIRAHPPFAVLASVLTLVALLAIDGAGLVRADARSRTASRKLEDNTCGSRRERRAENDLAPLDEDRYLRVGQVFASLDGVHRYRIPTLRAAHSRVVGPPMIVAVYLETEMGEIFLGSEEGIEVKVERIDDLERDGRNLLVVRVGNGGSCIGCSWLSILSANGARLERLVPKETVHELADVDQDGRFEALSLVTGLDQFAGLPSRFSPRLERVWACRKGRFVEADRDYLRYHWRRLSDLRRTLERPIASAPGFEQVGFAVSLYLEHEVLGQPADGLLIASHYLKWVVARGDRQGRRSAERALAALRGRLDRLRKELQKTPR
jgi:hypothetical protein